MPLHYSDPEGVTAHGTPVIGYDNATSPESRTDIPPAQRIGMPLFDPALYEAPDKGDYVDAEVVDASDDDGKHALTDGTDDTTGTVAKRGGSK